MTHLPGTGPTQSGYGLGDALKILAENIPAWQAGFVLITVVTWIAVMTNISHLETLEAIVLMGIALANSLFSMHLINRRLLDRNKITNTSPPSEELSSELVTSIEGSLPQAPSRTEHREYLEEAVRSNK